MVTVLSTTQMTLSDWGKLQNPDGSIASIIEILAQQNEMLDDMVLMEGNLPTGHLTTVRTGLPTVYWRMLNAGVLPSKAHTAQITEQCGLLEAYSTVDQKIAELGGNPGAVRISQSRAFLEAMNQEVASTFIYGSSLAPSEFIGLAARYSDTTAGNGDNIIKAGGTGSTDNTSIYLVAWDQETVCGIFPKGSSAGLKHEDLGIETVENANGVTGALMRAYRDHFTWEIGLALKDWRYAVRIANIDVSMLTDDSGNADLIKLMADAEERLPGNLGRRAFYMNRTVRRKLRYQAHSQVKAGGGLTYENLGGKRVSMFGTTPVRIVDAILNTEDVVV
jgi:hypothetical protein